MGFKGKKKHTHTFDDSQRVSIETISMKLCEPIKKMLIFQFYRHLIFIIEQKVLALCADARSTRRSFILTNNIAWKNDAYYSW